MCYIDKYILYYIQKMIVLDCAFDMSTFVHGRVKKQTVIELPK